MHPSIPQAVVVEEKGEYIYCRLRKVEAGLHAITSLL